MTDRITITVPTGQWLSSNRPISNRGYLQRIRNELHNLAIWTARSQKLDRYSGQVSVQWTVRYPKGVRRDKGEASNAQPTTKAILDGIVNGGYLVDDGPKYVVKESFQRGKNLDRKGCHEVELLIVSQEVTF